MELELTPLNYAKEALEPEISRQTMEFHHDKHFQTYINNFNQQIVGSGLEDCSLEDVIRKASGPLFNNAAQAWNHQFFFDSLSEKKGQKPLKKTEAMIVDKWKSLDTFKEEFTKSANAHFGSGWTWLFFTQDKELNIRSESNASNPMSYGLTPILTFDLWEHAYYLDYKNRRADYIKALWNLINWEIVEKRIETYFNNIKTNRYC